MQQSKCSCTKNSVHSKFAIETKPLIIAIETKPLITLSMGKSHSCGRKNLSKGEAASFLKLARPQHPNVKSMELEAKSMIENAWYDCIVSISSKDLTLEVQSVERQLPGTEYLYSQEVALAQLRPRSEPLSGEACLEVKEGQILLSQLKIDSGGDLRYDGKVEKVRRLRHASGAICKCSFEIRSLEGLRKGEKVTVRADAVRRLVNADISNHPVIAEWLSLLESDNCTFSKQAHSKSSLVDSDTEEDIQTRLEQQVEQIAQSVEVVSRNISCQETGTRKKRGRNGGHSLMSNMDQAAELVLLDSIPSSLSEHHKGVSHGTAIKEDVHYQQQILTSIIREEKRPRLSPLAARSALAASMQDILELSHNESRRGRHNSRKLTTLESNASVSQSNSILSMKAAADSKGGIKNITNTRTHLPPRKPCRQLTHRSVTRASANIYQAKRSPGQKKEALDPPKLADLDLKLVVSSPNSPGKTTIALHLGEKLLKCQNKPLESKAQIEFPFSNSESQISAASGKALGGHRCARLGPEYQVQRKSPRLQLNNGPHKAHFTEPKMGKLHQKAAMPTSPVVEIKSQTNASAKVSGRRSSRPSVKSAAQKLSQHESISLQVRTYQFESLNRPCMSTRSRGGQSVVEGLRLRVRNGKTCLSKAPRKLKSIVSLTNRPTHLKISSSMHESSQPRRSSRLLEKYRALHLSLAQGDS